MTRTHDRAIAKARAPLSRRKKLVFGLVPLLAVLCAGELVGRLLHGPVLCWDSYRQMRLDVARRGYPAVRDPLLGYVPKPSYDSSDNVWGTRVTIDADGFRSNGGSPPPGGSVVAVGDSYTFGDDVSDHETWPAYLEQQLGRCVKNGGVFGYGFDQTVLRAEQILERWLAELLVVSLIHADVPRCEFSTRYAPKPYFDIVEGELALRTVPVAAPSAAPGASRWLKDAIGHSALADALLASIAGEWWWTQEKVVRVHPHGMGTSLAVLLVDRVAALCRTKSCALLLVVQGDERHHATDAVIAAARRTGVPVLDLVERLARVEEADPGARERFWNNHMSPEGNQWVAAEIARYLADAELLK